MAEFLAPVCPFCDRPPQFIVGLTQAFCGNDDCELWFWDPTKSLDDNLSDAGVVRWEPAEGSDGPAEG